MKKQYIIPKAHSVQFPVPLLDGGVDFHVSKTFGEGEASRESKFGLEESDTEDHENFWDE